MTTKRTEELKPCPFCGGTDLLTGTIQAGELWWGRVDCAACSAHIGQTTEEKAIAIWNTRSLTPQAGEGVERVAKALCLSNGDDWNREGPGGLDGYRERARAAIAAIPPAGRVERDPLDEMCAKIEADAVAGLRYIERHHGRLEGVGWDRVFDAHDELFRLAQERGQP